MAWFSATTTDTFDRYHVTIGGISRHQEHSLFPSRIMAPSRQLLAPSFANIPITLVLRFTPAFNRSSGSVLCIWV